MSSTTDEVNKKDQIPIISIQSDWDDVIFSSTQFIWISCKFLGRESIHSKLKNHGKGTLTCSTNDFSVESFTQNALKIKFNASGHTYIFVPPLKTFSKIHKSKVVSLSVGEVGMGVSVCAQNNLIVWSSVTGEILKTLSGHVCDVYKCKFFPSGIVILSGGADMQLKIWSAETGDCPVTLIGHKAAINDFCMIDRGRNVISVSKDGTAKLWDCGMSKCISTIFESNHVLNCCSVGIRPEYIKVTKDASLNDREVGTENKLLVIGTEEGYLYGVAVSTREVVFSISAQSAVNVALILKDRVIIGCQNGKIEIYVLSNINVPERIIHESHNPVVSGCIYKDIGFVMGRNDGTVIYYDCFKHPEKRVSLTGSNCDPITDISCSGIKIFTSCRDGKIRQYVIEDLVSAV